ncbi:histidine ammonia-lyase [Halobacteriales archaeon QS_1_67_19]|nr:MAG: histidine ammonia-lyase [Halobacteriales archaeon QS_1_67_19]
MIRINGSLTIDDVVAVARRHEPVELGSAARTRIAESRRAVEEIAASDRRVYGVNTGLGDLQDVSVPCEDLRALQRNLLRSHAASVGDPLPTDAVRAAMLARANGLAVGASGVRVELVKRLLALLNEGVHPVVPGEGSTDDLGAAAHIGLVLMGEGRAEFDGERLPADRALAAAGIDPLDPAAKEGLAVVSGTPVMTGLLALSIADAERLVRSADLAGAWTFELLGEAPSAFAERVIDVRPHEGQADSARNLRRLIGDAPEADSRMTQDPLSLRCIPQVHGSAREQLAFARRIAETELQSATDNPLVFPDGETFSCGNFNGQQVAVAADALAAAVQKLGRASERRANKLVSDADDLAAFLAADPGLESGMMIAHYTAAGLVADLETRGPASGGSVTVSGGQEDVHSLGTIAARRLADAVASVRRVLAVELLCAARRTQLDGADLPDPLAAAATELDGTVELPLTDVALGPKIDETAALLASGRLTESVRASGTELA